MKTIPFRTMDATGYGRMIACNAGMLDVYGFNSYPATKLDVPVPSSCPCCHKSLANDMMPIMAINNANKNGSGDVVDECKVISIYRCTSCNDLFAIWSEHAQIDTDDSYVDDDKDFSCNVINEYPFDALTTVFSEDINNLSNEFVIVYNQSELAEHQCLNEICGMGYRRSLEFLVDAYIRYKHPEQNIKTDITLANKISTYISDERIRKLAQKAAWLGNDATHIEKKHPERDVSDMKKFINAMVHLIDTDFAFEDAESI